MTTETTLKTKRKKLSAVLGETFREARERAGLTQADVAERAGMATEVYGRMERGLMLPSVPSLRRLCLVLRVDANAVLGLNTREAAAWVKDVPHSPEDSPKLRRMLRTLRQLDEPHLAAVHAMVLAMAKLPGQQQTSTEEDESGVH